jgi:hypothetical protein
MRIFPNCDQSGTAGLMAVSDVITKKNSEAPAHAFAQSSVS